jgi:hypothetical protein
MSTKTITGRWTAAIALSAMSLASLAPMAHAGHAYGHGNKWRNIDPYSGWQVHRAPARVIVRDRDHSSLGPALAGLVGGLVLGAAISHAAPVHETVYYRDSPAYDRSGSYDRYSDGYDVGSSRYYYDPYTEERYASLDACGSHYRNSGHTTIILLIDARSGRCIDRYAYGNGGWREYRGERYCDYRVSDNGWGRGDDRYGRGRHGDDDDD